MTPEGRQGVERLNSLARRMSGAATVLQRTHYRWTDTERQQFNRLCEWSREAFDIVDMLALLLAEAPQAFVPGEKAKENADTRGADTQYGALAAASENVLVPTMVTIPRAVFDGVMDALESDADVGQRRAAFEAAQDCFDASPQGQASSPGEKTDETQPQETTDAGNLGELLLFGKTSLTRRWQPIATAPKDGTPILVWRDSGVHLVRWKRIGGSGFFDEWHVPMRNLKIEPTHWMPLPAQPSDSGDGNQPPSGLRGDPGAPRTVNGEARDRGEAMLDADFATHSDREVDDPGGEEFAAFADRLWYRWQAERMHDRAGATRDSFQRAVEHELKDMRLPAAPLAGSPTSKT